VPKPHVSFRRSMRAGASHAFYNLASASRAQVTAALKAISDVLNAIANHYLQSESRFDLYANHSGSVALLYLLHDGIKEGNAREARFRNGKPDPDDTAIKDI
jgi:hypothetical protein